MLGWKHQKIQKYCDEHGIVYSPWAKVDDRTEKLLDEAYFEAKIEADKKSTTKSQVPNFGKVKNCYAFYLSNFVCFHIFLTIKVNIT
jgi:hypothetical protein